MNCARNYRWNCKDSRTTVNRFRKEIAAGDQQGAGYFFLFIKY